MKFNCDAWRDRRERKREERIKRITQWHDWFAWRPVRLCHGDCRWLETVQRRRKTLSVHYFDVDYWEYRAK